MKAYKGFNPDLTCRDHQYTEGETYTHDGPVELCVSGYHACPMPLDTLRYYSPATSTYHEVEVDDDAQGEVDKVVSRTLRVGARLSIADMIRAHLSLAWGRVRHAEPKQQTSGDASIAATSGYRATAATSGDESIAVAGGYKCRARGAVGCWLVLAERDPGGHILDVKAVRVDGDTIRADTPYMLLGGQVVEVKS